MNSTDYKTFMKENRHTSNTYRNLLNLIKCIQYVVIWLRKPVQMPERYGRDEEDIRTAFKYTFKDGVDDDEGGNGCIVVETFTQEAYDMIAKDFNEYYGYEPEDCKDSVVWDFS